LNDHITTLEEYEARCPFQPGKIGVYVRGGRGARIELIEFDRLIERCNRTFGDTSKPVTGPMLPKE
jgi:hypothetical protein